MLGVALGLGLATPGLAHNVRAAKAAVVVVKLKPLTVKVSGLKASEPIVLRLTGDSTGTARGTASATGTVTLKLPKATLTTCSSFTLRALGTKGSVATLKKTAGAACKPTATVDFGSSVIVIGSRFKPGEHLSVTLIADGTRTKVGIAAREGPAESELRRTGAQQLQRLYAEDHRQQGEHVQEGPSRTSMLRGAS